MGARRLRRDQPVRRESLHRPEPHSSIRCRDALSRRGRPTTAPLATGPGLLGWFYADEADARGLTELSLSPPAAGLRFLTLTAHFFPDAAPLPTGRGMYAGLLSKADVVGFDLYPLQELCRPELIPWVFDAQRDLARQAAPKPTFQWIEVRQMKCTDPAAEVTAQTIRVESWLAIAAARTASASSPAIGARPSARPCVASRHASNNSSPHYSSRPCRSESNRRSDRPCERAIVRRRALRDRGERRHECRGVHLPCRASADGRFRWTSTTARAVERLGLRRELPAMSMRIYTADPSNVG